MRAGSVAVAVVVVVVALVGTPAMRVGAQSPADTVPRFEVASVKLGISPMEAARAAAESGGRVSMPSFGVRAQRGGRLMGTTSLQGLILRAYGLREYQIEGGPKWLTTDYFDIAAKAEPENATEAEMNEMLKSLLAERFGLRVHAETRQATVHTLTVARDDGRLGPGLKRTSTECEATLEERKRTGARPVFPSGPRESIAPICGVTLMRTTPRAGAITLAMGGQPLKTLVDQISLDLKAPVVNGTGLTGLFDIVLEYEPTLRFVGVPPLGAQAPPSWGRPRRLMFTFIAAAYNLVR